MFFAIAPIMASIHLADDISGHFPDHDEQLVPSHLQFFKFLQSSCGTDGVDSDFRFFSEHFHCAE